MHSPLISLVANKILTILTYTTERITIRTLLYIIILDERSFIPIIPFPTPSQPTIIYLKLYLGFRLRSRDQSRILETPAVSDCPASNLHPELLMASRSST